MKTFLNTLFTQFTNKDIEHALVRFFVEVNNIQVKKNKKILAILHNKTKNISEIISRLRGKFNNFSINDLQKSFELLIPARDRKLNGAFFTPPNITTYITTELITSGNTKICDPSCGCGAFLIAALVLLKNKFNKQIISAIESNIYGADILDYSVRRCKIVLALLALSDNEDAEEISFNIHKTDSLVTSWQALFPSIMREGGFDTIIGNPPYVKYQDLPSKIRKDLYTNWKTLITGNYNLYFAFFELGVSLLKQTGKLGYITPNNYFTSLAAHPLREFLQYNKHIDKIIDFNHLKIFDAQTYTCITFLSKRIKNHFLFERIDDSKKVSTLSIDKFSRINYGNLDHRKWRLLKEGDQANIKSIEATGVTLGSLVDIKVGIATCKDIVYFVDGNTLKNNYYKKEFNGKTYLIEKEITKSIVKISDIESKQDLVLNKRRVVFPYRISEGKAHLIPKNVLKDSYPECYKYLFAIRDVLKKRDKGKTKYEEWYSFARSQGLTLHGEKLLTPTFSNKPRFIYERDPESLFCNGYGIFLKNKSSLFGGTLTLKILSKALNSKIMDYYIKKTSVSIEGGYPCYQKNFIELFTIPFFNEEEKSYLDREENQGEIDRFLASKYRISLNAVTIDQNVERK